MGLASRNKGKSGEREARDQVKEVWNCPDCFRSAQACGSYSADLLGGPPGLHLEVKRYKRIVAADFMTQASEDAKDDEVPVVLMREDSGKWLVMVRMEDTPKFAERIRMALG